jgi:hypothetical protein
VKKSTLSVAQDGAAKAFFRPASPSGAFHPTRVDGVIPRSCPVPRFVVLRHDHPWLHWDLMLEVGAVLRTWRLSAPPSTGETVFAEPLGDHRAIYLDYEGPVSGDRGSVRRWDAGEYDGFTERDDAAGFRLHGTKAKGLCSIERDAEGWKLTLVADAG